MKALISLALALIALVPVNATALEPTAADKLRVVATIPDIADIVNRIGGDLVEVTSLTRGRENLHAVSGRPSQLVALSRADVFVQIGLSLEAAFAPGLLERARNSAIRPGKPGFVNLSDGWEALDVPESLSRKGGDLHPEGNPHLNLDPRGGRHMAQKVLEGLIRVAPGSRADFERRHAEYLKELGIAEARWAELGKSFAGRKVVVYHQEYVYLAKHYGIEILGSIELRPGIPATPNHLAQVVARMLDQEVRVILVSPWSQNREVERVSELSGATVVVLPNQAGGTQKAATWIEMMNVMHSDLASAFKATL